MNPELARIVLELRNLAFALAYEERWGDEAATAAALVRWHDFATVANIEPLLNKLDPASTPHPELDDIPKHTEPKP